MRLADLTSASDTVIDLGLDRDGVYSVEAAPATLAGFFGTVQAKPLQTLLVLGGTALLGTLLYDSIRPPPGKQLGSHPRKRTQRTRRLPPKR